MSTVHSRCKRLRAAGVPVHVRLYDTLIGEPRYWVYYGYAPPLAEGLTEREARLVVDAVARVHHKLRKEVKAA